MGKLTRKPGGWEVRLRYGAGQRGRFLITVESESVAEDRARRPQVMAARLANAGRHEESRDLLTRAAATASGAHFRRAERVVQELVPSDVVQGQAGPRTFRDVADLWTSGELHQRYPDDVAFKKPPGLTNSQAILATFFPLLGARAISSITTEEVDRAKQEIPQDLAPETRRTYIAHLRRVFSLAVDPLRLIDQSPVRGKFVPRRRAGREFPFIYPSEDAQLLACDAVAFEYRFLYGFLDRNGSRLSETLRATWEQADLTRGVFRMESTKTGRTRVWKLDPDVHRALQLRVTQIGGAPTGPIFLAPGGRRLTRQMVHGRFRKHLTLAGVTRRELHTETAERRKLRVHDLRATFVTLALAMGKSERWVMDRTGHQTSSQIAKYTRQARHAAELQLGWFLDLDAALGLVASLEMGHGVGLDSEKAWILGDSHTSRTSVPGVTPSEIRERSGSTADRVETPGPAEIQGVGQPRSSAGQDEAHLTLIRIEQALALALEVAMAREQWQLAQSIVNELGERRRGRTSPGVTSLDQHRAKKNGEKP